MCCLNPLHAILEQSKTWDHTLQSIKSTGSAKAAPRRLLIDAGHPADLHLFRNMAVALMEGGWEVLFAARDKDLLLDLLRAYNLPFEVITANRGGVLNKIGRLPGALHNLHRIIKHFQPGMAAGAASLHGSWICAAARIPYIGFIDTEPRRLVDTLTLPLVNVKITADSYYRKLGSRQFRYPGSHELAYLHPARFRPQASVRKQLGLQPDETYAIIRFVTARASHDLGMPRLSEAERHDLVSHICRYKRVFVTAEGGFPAEFQHLAFPLPPKYMHDALAFADLYAGEGITMAAEAAVLGTPALLLNSQRMGYCLEAEKKGMLFRFSRFNEAARHQLDNLLTLRQTKSAFSSAHAALLNGKIDVTAFMIWFVERWPESAALLRENPDFVRSFLPTQSGRGAHVDGS